MEVTNAQATLNESGYQERVARLDEVSRAKLGDFINRIKVNPLNQLRKVQQQIKDSLESSYQSLGLTTDPGDYNNILHKINMLELLFYLVMRRSTGLRRCLMCQHTWEVREGYERCDPLQCPHCHSSFWQTSKRSYTCIVCDHNWVPFHQVRMPLACPHCGCRYWYCKSVGEIPRGLLSGEGGVKDREAMNESLVNEIKLADYL